MAEDKKIDLLQLRQQFAAWQVPSEVSFSRLIDVAALPFKPGNGLAGGDPSTEIGGVDVGGVTLLHIQVGDGIQITAKGMELKPAAEGGVALTEEGAATVAVSGGLKVGKDGIGILTSGALQGGAELSIVIDEKQGIRHDEGNVAIHFDPMSFEADNALRVRCRPSGGLCLDEQGCLVLDIKTILGDA